MKNRLAYTPIDLDFKPLVPWTWPQNDLVAPNGYNSLSRIDPLNRSLRQREGFNYSGATNALIGGQSTEIIIPIDQSADFWCTNILITTWDSVTNTLNNGNAGSSTVTISDIRTNYKICENPTPVVLFTRLSNFTNWSSLPEPYCFVRDTGVQFNFTVGANLFPIAPPTFIFYIRLSGWKEYANASI